MDFYRVNPARPGIDPYLVWGREERALRRAARLSDGCLISAVLLKPSLAMLNHITTPSMRSELRDPILVAELIGACASDHFPLSPLSEQQRQTLVDNLYREIKQRTSDP